MPSAQRRVLIPTWRPARRRVWAPGDRRVTTWARRAWT